MSLRFKINHFLSYHWKATNAHGIHPPFLFDFYNDVIADHRHFYHFETVESLRKSLLKNHQPINLLDFGAKGSPTGKSKQALIGKWIKNAAISPYFGRVLGRTAEKVKAKNILELGTHAGLSGLYMLLSCPKARLTTFEGCPQTAQLAKTHFDQFGLKVEQVLGNIDHTLEKHPFTPPYELIYIDANHTQAALLRYFELLWPLLSPEGVIILDDINWSEGMYEGFMELAGKTEVKLSLDLFRMGMLFKNPKLSKSHVVLKK